MNVDEPVHIVAYDPRWPALFAAEQQRLCGVLALPHADLEHIGSTAVPDLDAKPVVDLMLGVHSYPPSSDIVSRIERSGYENLGEAGVPERIYFRCRSPQAFNLHLVQHGRRHWVTNLALRDYLRTHASARALYAAAKRRALASGHDTLLAYSDAKGSVIGELIAEALRWNDTRQGAANAKAIRSDDDEDLPYGENFHDEAVAADWAAWAIQKRPWRPRIFELFADAVNGAQTMAARVLELGSGPGFLAEHVLDRCTSIERYTLLDFSQAMLNLSRQRLARHATRTRFIQADFKSDSWPAAAGGPFDFILSLQAIHELRHKRHAPRLYAQAHRLLAPTGELIVCDHLPDIGPTERHRRLYMPTAEYLAVLAQAGFRDARVVWNEHEMAMYNAQR